MNKNEIKEESVLRILNTILTEETSKVNRNEYNKVQFKMDEVENQLIETIKELRKLQDSIPEGLKMVCSGRVKSISDNLTNSHSILKVLKSKVKNHKKGSHGQNMNDKK
jgi:esterase/lipase